ncbi:hypothetical protein [uncultured Draconibacterium sp.]|uniref:hypothetical protein n=1 Tax=uncultured Draconibacterium sp. TaxID=1573823 RepID=UPI002AA91696|nr:hypothetical protein [uncultured Draconibacterium sp.]
MKHLIPVLLILLFGCQNKPDIVGLINEQLLLLDWQQSQLMDDVYLKTVVNPEKYSSIKSDLFPLIETGKKIENEILSKEIISEFVFKNSRIYLSNLIDKISNQDTKSFLSKQKDEWLNHLKSSKKLNTNKRTLLLSKLKAIENVCIREIISQYQVNDYSFNKIYPIVIENKKVLNKGEVYTAKIVMAGIDTTLFPIIKINEKEIPINEKGQGILNIQTNKTGTYNWTGVFKFFNEKTGIIKNYQIEGEYKVK